MLEQFYTNIVVVFKIASSYVLTNSPQQKRNVPKWNKDVREAQGFPISILILD